MRTGSILSAGDRKVQIRRTLVHCLQASVGLSLLYVLIAQPGLTTVTFAALGTGLTINVCMLAIGVVYAGKAVRELDSNITLFEDARRTHQQIEELFAMTDMLQAADDHDDAGAVLKATSARLLPEYSGALYVFNNSRDRLDLAASWNDTDGHRPIESLLPSTCWALKRGKPHLNDPHLGTLSCMHPVGPIATVEIPMMARGQVFGLLVLGTNDDDAFDKLRGVHRLSRALADSMSLALSNIALREKLRTQSLRDPLTGLYNRRYMEDALQRYIDLAERGGCPTSVIMIDLDNFKRLNDQHGHAKGDAVLRDVAAQLVGGLRPSDVVARFGGEELLVILPNCGLDEARDKAETLRARIAGLSDSHDAEISASFGVACVPETASGASDVVPMADSALYCAKQAGKNRVHVAERRAERIENTTLLVVT